MMKKLNILAKTIISSVVLSTSLLFFAVDNQPILSPISAEAATVTKYTTTANLNLRAKKSTKAKILLTIPKGKEVTYIKKSGDWYKVKYKGKTGWVNAKYIKKTTTTKTETVYTTTANLNLRETKSTKGKILLTIPKGKEVTYIKKSGDWYKVKYKGKTGWVSAKYIKKTTKKSSNDKTKTNNNDTTKDKPKTDTNTTKPTTPSENTPNTPNKPNETTTNPTDNTQNNNQPNNNNQNEGKTKLPEGQSITEIVVYPGTNLNLRESNSTSSKLLDTIPKFTKLKTNYKTTNNWFKVSYNGKTGFVSGAYLIDQTAKDRIDKLEKNKNSYLFMDLRTPSSVTAEQINTYINNRVGNDRSVLKNTGKYFLAAAEKFGVNALYLAAHAIHESNFGKSEIALDRYNLFGFGAYDLVPYLGSVKFESVEQNIYFIAQRIKATYLGSTYHNQGTFLGYSVKSITDVRVDELSKGMNFYYASDSAWGEKIAKHMNNILDYSKEEAKNKEPNTTIPANPSYPNGSDVFPATTLAVAKNQINLYHSKSQSTVVATIKKGDQFNLLEKDNNYWLKVNYKGKTYYTTVPFHQYNSYFTVKNLGRVSSGGSNVNIRQKATTSSTILGTVKHKDYIELVLNEKQNPIKENGFYKIKANGIEGWVSATYIVQELNK